MSSPAPAPPPPAYGIPAPMPSREQSMLPMIGGLLLIVGAIISISFWAWLISLGALAVSMIPGIPANIASTVVGIIAVCGAIFIILALITLLGGVMTLQRKMWGLALVGGILG